MILRHIILYIAFRSYLVNKGYNQVLISILRVYVLFEHEQEKD